MKPITIRNAKITQRTSEGFGKYLNEIQKIPLLSTEEETELGFKAYSGDASAQEELVRRNLRFVISIAKFYDNIYSPLEDLVNEGNIGLIEAAKRFNPNQNIKFISFAVWYIRGQILKYQDDKSRLIRLPANKINGIRKMNTKVEEQSKLTNTEVTVQELDNEAYDYLKALDSTQVFSLDKPLTEESYSTLLDTLEDTTFKNADTKAVRSELFLALDTLKPRHKEAVIAYYGLGGEEPKNLREISTEMNITKQRISQMLKASLRELRGIVDKELLQELNP